MADTLIKHVEDWLDGKSFTVLDISIAYERLPDPSKAFPQVLVVPSGLQIYSHRTTQAVDVQLISKAEDGYESHYQALIDLAADLRGWNDVILREVGETLILAEAYLMANISLEDNR